jgi:hypothetical protein
MDTLHDVMRAIGTAPRAAATRRDHLTVFREFLDHLERVSRQQVTTRTRAAASRSSRRR